MFKPVSFRKAGSLLTYLNKLGPSASTVPTSGEGPTFNISDYVDKSIQATMINNVAGTVTPTVHKPASGAATARLKFRLFNPLTHKAVTNVHG